MTDFEGFFCEKEAKERAFMLNLLAITSTPAPGDDFASPPASAQVDLVETPAGAPPGFVLQSES
jgi:hypothetical protein